MLDHDDRQVLRRLRSATLDILRDVIGAGPVAVLDAPNQLNVGDSLIWAGELAHLRALDMEIAYVADIGGWIPAELRRRMPTGTILIHGGGNFGDIWPGHQDHRERLLREFPDYPIVQLAQSVWFSSPEEAARANAAMSAHPDFVSLLRDPESMQRGVEQLPDVRHRFCYDMALGYDPEPTSGPEGTSRVLVIARADRESRSGLADADPDWLPGALTEVTDWHHSGLSGAVWTLCRRAARLHQRYASARRKHLVPRVPGVTTASIWLLRAINALNIRAGSRLYDDTSIAVVDRLHAHVLASLLGVPNVLLDNSYGKLGAVYHDYTGQLSTAHYATSVAEARGLTVGAVAHTSEDD